MIKLNTPEYNFDVFVYSSFLMVVKIKRNGVSGNGCGSDNNTHVHNLSILNKDADLILTMVQMRYLNGLSEEASNFATWK